MMTSFAFAGIWRLQQTDANIGVSKISQQRSGLNSVDMFSRDSPSFEYKSVSFSEGDQVQIRHWLHARSVLFFHAMIEVFFWRGC